MPRMKNSFKYELKKRALENTKNELNNRTRTMYKRCIDRFANWAKERGYIEVNAITKYEIQDYEVFLEHHPKEYTPATIHAYLAPVCVAVGVPMSEIRKPKRTSATIVRSRHYNDDGNSEKNPQGVQEEKKPKYARVVALEKVVGIRRAELARLKGADLIHRGDDWFIVVRRGKGGKAQEQYILPPDVEIVLQVFSGVASDDAVFTKEELNNKIDFHRMRAEHAIRCYAYYAAKIDAEVNYAGIMKDKLLKRWEEAHERLRRSNPASWKRQRELFLQDMDERPYKLRGDNLSKALESGIPIEYNRLALMCVSVMHLSHWRLDVTVTNYIVR